MPKLEKHIVSELVLRIFASVAAVICVIVGSIFIASYPKGTTISGINLTATNGWFIFLSIVEIIFQVLAITDLILDIKLLKIKIPLGKTQWYLFNLIKLLASGVFIVGYLGSFIPISIVVGETVRLFSFNKEFIRFIISAICVTIFSLVAILCSILTLIFILVAKFKYKCTKYDPSDSEN